MGDKQEEHLEDIKYEFTRLVDAKYRAGQREHGGFLGDMQVDSLIDNAIDEAIDQVVYLLTLKEKINELLRAA